jgi:hypothetical protein
MNLLDFDDAENGPLLGDAQESVNQAAHTLPAKSQILSDEWQDPLDFAQSRNVPSVSAQCDVNPNDRVADVRGTHKSVDYDEVEEPVGVFRDRFWWNFFLLCVGMAFAILVYSLLSGDLSILERRQGQADILGEGILQISRLKLIFFLGNPAQSLVLAFAYTHAAHVNAHFVIHFAVFIAAIISIFTASSVFFTQVNLSCSSCETPYYPSSFRSQRNRSVEPQRPPHRRYRLTRLRRRRHRRRPRRTAWRHASGCQARERPRRRRPARACQRARHARHARPAAAGGVGSMGGGGWGRGGAGAGGGAAGAPPPLRSAHRSALDQYLTTI